MATQDEMLHMVQSQLAVDLNCTIDDLNGEKDRVISGEAKDSPGRGPFPRKEHFFEIVSMGKSIVVSATPERLSIARTQMRGKDRDAIFSLLFIRGLYLHYLPDLRTITPLSPPAGFSPEMMQRDEVIDLLEVKGLNNALIYDTSHPYQTDLVMLAKKDGETVGMAGASKK